MTNEQLERFKRYGIPIDDGLIRLAQIGEENKAKMQAAAERREAEKAKANVSGNEQTDTSPSTGTYYHDTNGNKIGSDGDVMKQRAIVTNATDIANIKKNAKRKYQLH